MFEASTHALSLFVEERQEELAQAEADHAFHRQSAEDCQHRIECSRQAIQDAQEAIAHLRANAPRAPA